MGLDMYLCGEKYHRQYNKGEELERPTTDGIPQKSVQLDPQDAEAYYNLGVIFRELGKLEEAEKSYRKAILLKPDYAEAYSNIGVIFKKLGKLNEAEASYRKAIELKPDYAVDYLEDSPWIHMPFEKYETTNIKDFKFETQFFLKNNK